MKPTWQAFINHVLRRNMQNASAVILSNNDLYDKKSPSQDTL